jgi:hypothetical protein
MVVLAHFAKEELLELIWIKSELKRRRKGQGFGCSRVRSCNLTRSQITAIVEGGTALFGGQKVGTTTARACH